MKEVFGSILLHEREVKYFLNKNAVIEPVKEIFPNVEDDELMEDLGEFLSHIAKDMFFKANLPVQVKEYVEMQKGKKKGSRFDLETKILIF